MKFYKFLIGFGLITALLLIILPFLGLPILSTNTKFIASYGAYLSGTIAPLISALAFVALLKTLSVQQEQLKQSSLESQRNSLQVVLNKWEENIDEGLNRHNISVTFNDEYQYKYRDLLLLEFFTSTYKDYLPLKTDKCEGKNQWLSVKGQEIMGLADLNLLRLAATVKRYDKLCIENTMHNYYFAKYNVPIDRLDKLGYLNQENLDFWKKA
ncbi:hypothetical protein H5186_18955 [Pseudoalteromonas sp. SG41-2]|uniref:hypothetical protein n=1 Tax=Pseudoalteromonas sp. SG41-2 TaxID=2760978 RepID=UPI001602E891|nr:hypothetical protein [Pseudoalteromonas sp. SG41-2]MBB1481514.1 hypothetical protein [Pseudoalteromonas sp. SG41-2]